MENKKNSLSVWLFIISVFISIATNVATSVIPDGFHSYLWLAWPILFILVLISVLLSKFEIRDPKIRNDLVKRQINKSKVGQHSDIDFLPKESNTNFFDAKLDNSQQNATSDATYHIGFIFGTLIIYLGFLLFLWNSQRVNYFFWGGLFFIGGLNFLYFAIKFKRKLWWTLPIDLVLLSFGIIMLLPDSLNIYGGMILLGSIALAFLLIYLESRTNRWWALLLTGFFTTLGIVPILPERIGAFPTGGVLFFGLALTFLLVALAVGMRWAYYPAAVLGVMGVLTTASLMNWANYIWAVVLIAAGGFLAFRAFAKH